VIRGEGPIQNIEDWEGRDVVLTLAIPGEKVKVERVLITAVIGNWILCRDLNRRDQVYSSHFLVGWEPYDGLAERALQAQEDQEFLQGEKEPPPAPKEDPGIREVGKVRKVIQQGGIGGPVKMK
jgi:hypothetical protein